MVWDIIYNNNNTIDWKLGLNDGIEQNKILHVLYFVLCSLFPFIVLS